MPFAVRPIWPARNALLFDGSSHADVPGMKVAYSFFAYSSALIVLSLSITTLLFSSTSDEPCDQISQRSEEHTSELPSLMRSSSAVFCLKKKKTHDYCANHHKRYA